MRKPNDRHGDKNPETKDDLKLALDADELTELSNKESESDSKRAVVTKSAVNVDMLSLDKATLDTISTNQRALKAFVSLLETDVAMFKKYNLVRLLAVASVRLERLIFETNPCFAYDTGCSKFKFETIEVVQLIPHTVKEGDVVTITRFESGRTWTVPLYIPQHWVDKLEEMKSFMDNMDKQHLYVSGMQGCGKTCFLWMWANMLMNQGRRVLVIRYRTAGVCPIWILEDGKVKELTSSLAGTYNVANAVRELLKKETRRFDVCICNGVPRTDETCDILRSMLYSAEDQTDGMICKLVFETAFYFKTPTKYKFVAAIRLASWQVADYDKAALSDFGKHQTVRKMLLTDWNSLKRYREEMIDMKVGSDAAEVDTNCSSDIECASDPGDANKLVEAVRWKYFYAGGCPRFMFEMNIDTLQLCLDQFASEFGGRDVPDNLKQFVPGILNSRAAPVSKYVLFCAYRYGRSDFTDSIEHAARATASPLLTDWHFELKQYDIIRSALDANKNAKMTRAVEMRSDLEDGTDMTGFSPQAETSFNGSAIEDKVVGDTVIWNSNLWNQGCFDVAFYFGRTIVTLQFGATDPPLLKVDYLKPLRTALLDKGVDVKRMVHVVVDESFGESFLKETTRQWQGTGAKCDASLIVELATSRNVFGILDRTIDSLHQGSVRYEIIVD